MQKKNKNPKSKKDYNSNLTLTVESRIEKDEVLYQSLEEYAIFYNYLKRRMFNILYNVSDDFDNDFKNEMKRSFLEEYNIHARLFESILIEVRGQLKCAVELQDFNIRELNSKLKKTEKTINKFSKWLNNNHMKDYIKVKQTKINIHNLNQKRNRLIDKIRYYKTENIMFGTRKFFKKQYTDDKYINNHEAWLEEWHRRRNFNFQHVGAACETSGNSLCQYSNNGGIEYLTITMPHFYENKYLKVPVKFTTERESKKKYYSYFHEAHKNKFAVSYRFLKKENGYWYVQAGFTLQRQPKIAFNGYLGVDINYGLFVTSEVDRNGNYAGVFKEYNYNSVNKSSEQVEQIISVFVNDIVDRAKQSNLNIIIEDIDLENKKSGDNKTKNRKVNAIEYAIFRTLIINRCLKEGVHLNIVNPVFTSIIGRHKYMNRFGVSVHTAAAIAIARRGGGFKERIPRQLACILQGGEAEKWSYIFRYRHHWKHWSFLNQNLLTCLKKFNSVDSRLAINMNYLTKRFSPDKISFLDRLENTYAEGISI